MDLYQKKYIKYKEKYLLAKNELEQEGGAFSLVERDDIYPVINIESSDLLHENLKKQASKKGKRLLDRWLYYRAADITKVTSLFEWSNGKYRGNLSATTFSDYNKWTMMSIIWHLYDFIKAKTGKNTFKVTFGVDIRDEKMRKAINKDEQLKIAIQRALINLSQRKFKKEIFEAMNRDSRLLNKTLKSECIDYICDSRTLAKDVIYDKTGKKPNYIDKDDEVHIYFYKVTGAKDDSKDTEDGLWFIEARGPWPRVTWLETSMMQAVYEAYLRYNLEKLAKEKNITQAKAYERWLYGALLRCARSVAFTRLVQTRDQTKQMTPALFTGRRTGSYLFLLLQNLFFAHHFRQFNPTDKTMCLGTSSVDCYYELKNLGLNYLTPVGTHDHELSMVISVLFPYFDKNKFDLPLTQIIGHELYRFLSAVPRPTPLGMVMFPMLPDTLGTAAFMKAANLVKMSDGKSFISLITSARQDSGKLEDFLKLMTDWAYSGEKMASKIDNTEILLKAARLGYSTFGADDFFGDSAKVWNPCLSSPYMAVNAVNVEYCIPRDEEQFYKDLDFPHIMVTSNSDGTFHVKGYPIKVGDPEDMTKPALAEGILSLDKTLLAKLIELIKKWVSDRRVRAFSSKDNVDIKAASLDITLFTGYNLKPTAANLAIIRG